MQRSLIAYTLLTLLASCDSLPLGGSTDASEQGRTPVARVKSAYLYQDDLEAIVADNDVDSVKITRKYIDGWIKKQLLINEASSVLSEEKLNIERKVLDYQYALITHEYEKLKISEQLNTEVSEEEIQVYYAEKREDFLLKQNIVRCLFAKVPKEAPQVSSFRRQIRAYPQGDLEEIRSFAFRFAANSFMEDSIWINFDEVIQNTSLASIPNKVEFLRSNTFVESSDEEHIYFLRLLEYKISNEVSPLEFIRDDIRNIIINKRKLAIKEALQESVYKRARENEEFEIYVN